MEVVSTVAILDNVSIVLSNMLSDIFDILPISTAKATILPVSTSVAESYLVVI
jgi:hypothetical protein